MKRLSSVWKSGFAAKVLARRSIRRGFIYSFDAF